jgi:two-component system, OmpR family, sensor kinase
MSIRLRLTLVYTVILALIVTVFSVALYYAAAQFMYRNAEIRLKDEAARITGDKYFRLDRIPTSNSKFASTEIYAQTRDNAGRVVARSPNLEDSEADLPISANSLHAAQEGQSATEIVSMGNSRLLVYSKPIKDDTSRVSGLVQVALSVTSQEESLNSLKWLLSVGCGIVIALAFGIGWGFSATTFQPIHRITQTAQEIAKSQDFGRRVNHNGPPDEVGRLVTTFNEMLTALQHTQERTEQALQRTELALQSQRQFAADASHELRTPLTTIRGNLALLQREPPIEPEDRLAVLDDMVSEVERMARLVHDLLTLARFDAGQGTPVRPVLIQPVIEQVYRQAASLAPQHRIRMNVPANVTALANDDAFKQVMLILLDNAIKFNPNDSVVAIEVKAVADKVSISVSDSGVGIPPSDLPHIFNRFYRGDSARSSPGSGLGLAIAKARAEAQGGTLTVDSRTEQGTTFTLNLRRATLATDDDIP